MGTTLGILVSEVERPQSAKLRDPGSRDRMKSRGKKQIYIHFFEGYDCQTWKDRQL